MTRQGAIRLTDGDLEALDLTSSEIADSIEDAIRAQAAGRLWCAPKSAVVPGDGRYVMTTLSVADAPRLTVIKTAMVSPRNPERGLESTQASVFLLDSETGLLRCVMGGNWVTAVRTAGLSAVMARRLANPHSRSVAFVGSGAQARSQLDSFASLFPLAEVRVYGRGQANIERLSERARALGLAARTCASAQEALDGADLVVTSITLDYEVKPFLDAGWLKPGAFAAITAQALPWRSASLSAFGAVFIDDRAQEAASPKPMVDPALVAGDLAEVVTGAVPAGFDPALRTAFVFRGVAVGDFAVAALGYNRAVAQGRGNPI